MNEVRPYHVDKMLRHQQELQEIMHPESVQILTAFFVYLQSWEFFALVILFLVYFSVKRYLK